VSPFIGRLDDIGQYGSDLVTQIMQMFENYGISTEVIAASIRGPAHVLDSALVGCDIATIPYETLKLMVKHPKTDEGIAKFNADYEKSKKN
jgi:transaldolase